MKKSKKKWMTAALAAIMGLCFTGYSVYASEGLHSGYIEESIESEPIGTLSDYGKSLPDGSTLIEEPDDLVSSYGQTLGSIVLPEGWTWEDPDLVLNETIPWFGIGYNSFAARFDVSQYENQYDFTNVQGYQEEQHCVVRDLEVFVSMADSTISFKEYVKLDKVYDGTPVSVFPDDVITTGSSGEISITYDEERVTPFGTVYWARLDEAPAGAGSYRVNVVLKEDQWHSTVSLRTEFTISKADIQLEIRTDNMDKVYDGKEVENPPTYQAGGSNVRRLSWYEKNADGDWVLLGSRPVNAGIYKVVAAAEGDDNYNSAETELIFEITKAIPSYTLPEDLTAAQGQALSSVKLPEGFVWVDGAQKAESLGSQVFQANFVPADSRNYQTIEVGIPVRVIPASAAQNHKPEITAEDVTLTVGDSFDALANATASDAEDGDLTDRIEVLSSQVDTSRAGTYQVVYSVTDSQGETVTKTVTVTVKGKAVSQGQNQNSNPAANQTKTENQKTQVQAVQTGDHTNVYVWSAVLIISMAGAAVCILYKRKTYQ